jgi:phospholipid/cholesterol/gamma-HCH transport system permease protein
LGAVARVGHRTIAWTGAAGRASIFLARALAQLPRPPFRAALVLEHMYFIGNRSLGIIGLTSAFTGMVLMLQGYQALARFGSEAYLGPLVALSLLRELGPVLGALMISARAGSSIAATIASMRVSEQIDALETMSVEPLHYLVAPRLLAAILVVPLLTVLFSAFGILAGREFGVFVFGIDGSTFDASVRASIESKDLLVGLYKSIVFAVIVAWISSFQGFEARFGALGVGQATTRAVVVIASLVLVSDYVMSALLFT